MDLTALVTNAQTLSSTDAGLAELQTLLDTNAAALAASKPATITVLQSGRPHPRITTRVSNWHA